MMAKLDKIKEITRFATVGGANTVIDFGILFALKQIGVQILAANIISTSIAFLFSFVLNKKYTFRSTNKNVRREFVLFIVVTLFGLWVIQNAILWLVIPILSSLGMTDNTALLFAKLAATAISMVWNYVLYDKLVFNKNNYLS